MLLPIFKEKTALYKIYLITNYNKMKKLLLTIVLLAGLTATAQVGIGTTSPNANSILDLTATDKALVLPRVANTAAIASPVNGMMIYDLSSSSFKAYQNNTWIDLNSVFSTDAIAAKLTTSLSAYTVAATDTWVSITNAEYEAIVAGVSGVTNYGVPNATFATLYGGNIGTNLTVGVNSGNSSQVPSGSYPVAMRFKTKVGGTATEQLKFGATPQNTYNNYISLTPSFTAVPDGGVSCFVIKKPTAPLASTGYIAVFTDGGAGFALADTLNSTGIFYVTGNLTNGGNISGGNPNGYQPLIQVAATATKSW